MHILCIILNNAFLSFTHIGNLTLNSNVTCDSIVGRNSCINIIQDGITLDCNGYSIIGPGHENSVGFFVLSGVIVVAPRLKTSSTNHWRRMDSVRSNRALISLLSNLFFQIFDFDTMIVFWLDKSIQFLQSGRRMRAFLVVRDNKREESLE